MYLTRYHRHRVSCFYHFRWHRLFFSISSIIVAPGTSRNMQIIWIKRGRNFSELVAGTAGNRNKNSGLRCCAALLPRIMWSQGENREKDEVEYRWTLVYYYFFFNNFLLYCRFNNCLISFGKKKKIIPQFLKLFCKLYSSRRIVKLIIKYEMYHFVILNIFVLTM